MVCLRRKFLPRFFSFSLAILLCADTALLAADSKNLTEMVRIPRGAFLMGSNDGPQDERSQHTEGGTSHAIFVQGTITSGFVAPPVKILRVS